MLLNNVSFYEYKHWLYVDITWLIILLCNHYKLYLHAQWSKTICMNLTAVVAMCTSVQFLSYMVNLSNILSNNLFLEQMQCFKVRHWCLGISFPLQGLTVQPGMASQPHVQWVWPYRISLCIEAKLTFTLILLPEASSVLGSQAWFITSGLIFTYLFVHFFS